MKIFLTTIGERTTDLCYQFLIRYGFEVIILSQKESWINKYRHFIQEAYNRGDEKIMRIDADFIPNHNIKKFIELELKTTICQGEYYDLYSNRIQKGHPLMYSREAIKIIKNNFDKLDPDRPETSAWRLEGVVEKTFNFNEIIGLHGFFQNKEDVERALKHKEMRGRDFDEFNMIQSLL